MLLVSAVGQVSSARRAQHMSPVVRVLRRAAPAPGPGPGAAETPTPGAALALSLRRLLSVVTRRAGSGHQLTATRTQPPPRPQTPYIAPPTHVSRATVRSVQPRTVNTSA